MKKISIIALLVLFFNATQAAYTIKFPLESNQGGSLPNNSVLLQTANSGSPQEPSEPEEPVTEEWVTISPEYTAWVNQGESYDCTNWVANPAVSNQAFANCKQDQTRSMQNREQETLTNAIRNNGPVVTETQTVTVSSTCTSWFDATLMQHWTCTSN